MHGYSIHNGNAKNYIMDSKRMIQDFETKMIEVIQKDVRRYQFPREEVEKIAWLIAMSADEIGYSFGNEDTKIFTDPVEIDSENLEEHLPRKRDISEEEFTNKVSPILYDLKVFCNSVLTEIESRGIEENEEHRKSTYLDLRTLNNL